MSQIAGLLLEIYRRLLRAYGPQGWWPADTPFEVMVGALLTQATAWRNVERAIARLKEAGALSPKGIAALSQRRLEELIRPSGFFRQKARRLKALVELVLNQGGVEGLLSLPPEELRETLLSVPGIGPETADSILLYAAGHPVFVVDAYTIRILTRLGLLGGEPARYEEVQELFEKNLPPDPQLYAEYHALLVRHAKDHCRARPRCGGCPLGELCPASGRGG
ncbi:endonuclease III domain-containing protein [Candidatus Bipolaricaulota bacterium]|nr:endonuclease III domain-containing protein [Candidatus Bipolaricaulota bacterium]